MSERRDGIRCGADLAVNVGHAAGRICNLSMGGMLCFLNERVPFMKPLPITFTLDGVVISIQGTVLRCDEITKGNFSTGVYFNSTSFSQVQKNKLSIFLDKLRESIKSDD